MSAQQCDNCSPKGWLDINSSDIQANVSDYFVCNENLMAGYCVDSSGTLTLEPLDSYFGTVNSYEWWSLYD